MIHTTHFDHTFHSTQIGRHSPRRGLVMFVVAVIIVILTLGGVALLGLSGIEHEATRMRGDEIQAEQLLRSGVETITVAVGMTAENKRQYAGFDENPSWFRAVPVLPETPWTHYRGTGRFTVLSPVVGAEQITAVKYGMLNESARLHLGTVLRWEQTTPGQGVRSLMKLPGMTPSAVDSILDWIDEDKTRRPSGAELSYYQQTGAPYGPRNAVPPSLEELLLVRDVTRKMMFGEDETFSYRVANQPMLPRTGASMSGIDDMAEGEDTVAIAGVESNGNNGNSTTGLGSVGTDPFADPFDTANSAGGGSTADSESSFPPMPPLPTTLSDETGSGSGTSSGTGGSTGSTTRRPRTAGMLAESAVGGGEGLPLSFLLTTLSAEKEVDPTGVPKCYLNEPNLEFLHEQLKKNVGTDVADFVILYRQYGPDTTVSPSGSSNTGDVGSGTGSGRSRTRTSGLLTESAATSSQAGGGGSGEFEYGTGSSSMRNRSGSRSRRGTGEGLGVAMDFTVTPRFLIDTPPDIANITVKIAAGTGASTGTAANAIPAEDTVVSSPLVVRRGEVSDSMLRLLDFATCSREVVISGRININEAPRDVLRAIPRMTDQMADRIIAARPAARVGNGVITYYTPSGTSRSTSNGDDFRHPVWLVSSGILDVATLKSVWNDVTCGGDVYRAQVVSFYDRLGIFRRAEVVIDATVKPPRQVFYKDNTLFGLGFSREVLGY